VSGDRPRADRPRADHYSYSVYRDPDTARTFDDKRFGGPIGELIAATQARVLTNFIGRVQRRRILDVGTGTGRAALLLARGAAEVVGVDASEQMLAVARQRAAEERLDVHFELGDAHALRFGDRAFDVVVSLRVLMHTPDWRTCLQELCRVADQLVIFDYPSRRSLATLQAGARRLAHAAGARTEPYRVFGDAEIARALDACGFRVRSVHRQFVLPIAFHKAIGSRRFTLVLEHALDRAGLLRVFGSPVSLVAERCERS
jgi:2-polyprenyl-3-methyl-5-hydroxy-6-metoxy-1,4-benzoquinol methylase